MRRRQDNRENKAGILFNLIKIYFEDRWCAGPHCVPLEGRILAWSGVSELRFGMGSGGPLPSRSAQGAYLHAIPASGWPHSPPDSTLPAEGSGRPRSGTGWREKGRQGAIAIVLTELCTSSRSRSASERRGSAGPKPGGPATRGGAAEHGRPQRGLRAGILTHIYGI